MGLASGHKNIGYDKRNNLWIFEKSVNKKKKKKHFVDKIDAICYKFIFLLRKPKKQVRIGRRINPDKVLTQSERSKRSRENNREKIGSRQKKFSQTERGRYHRNKGHWKANGVSEPCEGWEKYYYDTFLPSTHCDLCNVEFVVDGVSAEGRCLDHHHSSGHIRNIVCRKCNIGRGRLDNSHLRVLLDLHRRFIF